VVAVIETDGAGAQSAAPAGAKSDAPPSTASGAKSSAPANVSASAPTAAKPEGAKPTPPKDAVQQKPAVTASGEKVRSSPLVRRIAREHDVDLSQVPGSGAGGRVSKSDILAAVEGGASSAAPSRAGSAPSRSSAPPPASGGASASAVLENAVPREKMYFGHYEVQPMSVMRQRIAEHMVLSKRVSPHVYSVDEVNVSGIAALRA
jgi:2-oxoglutarate dehydrogenase E2 component (dihydrolipoamide succinyltransferase)